MPDFNPQKINQSPVIESAPPINKTFYQANKFYIWAMGLAVVIIAVLAFFAFRPQAAPVAREADVQIQILAPETLPSGEDAVYRISLKNNDSVKLTDLELELVYPEGFSYVSSVPNSQNLSGSSFKIQGDLLPGQNPAVIVKVKTSGEINSEKRLLAKLRYKYSNFNSSFVKESSHTLRLVASDVLLEIDGPKETNSAQLVAYTVTYKNNSKDAIKNARVKLNYPAGFNYGSSQPQASLGGDTWNLGDLQSGAEGKIIVQGTFGSSQSGEEKKLEVQFLVLGQNGEYFVQSSAEMVTAISSQPLLVTLENLDRQEGDSVSPGTTLNFAVRYKNNAPVAATGVNIVVSLDSKALDFSSLQAQGGQVVGGTITWNAAGAPNLEILNPGEEGVLNFFVRVRNPATKDSSKNLSVKLTSKIKADEYSTFLPGSSLEIKISSPAEIQPGLSFISGSLPPKVGTQTRYKATLKLLNSTNDFSGGQLTVFLPSVAGSFSLDSVNAAESQNVQFDPATGRLTWNFGTLPAHAGKFNPAKILEFTVAANPSPSDAGNTLLLLRNIKFSAKDDFTGRDVNIGADDLTTASLPGQSGYSNGTVVP